MLWTLFKEPKWVRCIWVLNDAMLWNSLIGDNWLMIDARDGLMNLDMTIEFTASTLLFPIESWLNIEIDPVM